MNYEETLTILAILKSAYPKDYPFNMSVEDAKVMATVWNEQFLDVPGPVVELAVKKLISTEEKVLVSTVKKKIGSLYWEAKEILDNNEKYSKRGFCKPLSEQEKAFYLSIKKTGEKYRYGTYGVEPSINQLVGTDNNKLMLGGAVSGNTT